MVTLLCRLTDNLMHGWKRVAGKMAILALVCMGTPSALPAQQPPVHFWHPVGLPPGAIGSQQLQRGGPLPGFFQPVEIKAPEGVLISLAEGGQFSNPQAGPARVGLLIGQVYRLSATNLPLQPGVEVFPTIEVIDRLYAPRGQETRFPVVIELAREDLELAAQGKFVTRVIYVEDPKAALPVPSAGTGQSWFEVAPGMDPLVVADSLGRPIAIVRMGGRVPQHGAEADMAFLFGCPPVVSLPPRPSLPPAQAPQKEDAGPSARATKPNVAPPEAKTGPETTPR
jgi:hypothetical protein